MTGNPAFPKINSKLLVFGLATYVVLSLVSMAAMSIGAGLFLVCAVIAFGGPRDFLAKLASGFRESRSARIFACLSMIFVFAVFLSLLAAKLWPLEIAGKISDVHLLRDSSKLWYFAWPFVIWTGLLACTEAQRRRVLEAWILAFFALCLVAVQQHFTGWPRPQNIPGDEAHFHATLFLGHHLSVASILIFPFFAFLDWAEIPDFARWIGGALGFLGLMLTYSRALWVALPAGIVFWALLRLRTRGRIAVVLLLALCAAGAYQVPKIRARVMDPLGHQERWDLWEANWNFFKQRPITGVGLRHNEELSGYYLEQKLHTNNVFQGHAHNNVLDLLGSTGLIGTIAFVLWWGALLGFLVGQVRHRPQGLFFGRGLLAAFLVYQINGLTQVNFWEGKVQHQLMWMVAWVLFWENPRE